MEDRELTKTEMFFFLLAVSLMLLVVVKYLPRMEDEYIENYNFHKAKRAFSNERSLYRAN